MTDVEAETGSPFCIFEKTLSNRYADHGVLRLHSRKREV